VVGELEDEFDIAARTAGFTRRGDVAGRQHHAARPGQQLHWTFRARLEETLADFCWHSSPSADAGESVEYAGRRFVSPRWPPAHCARAVRRSRLNPQPTTSKQQLATFLDHSPQTRSPHSGYAARLWVVFRGLLLIHLVPAIPSCRSGEARPRPTSLSCAVRTGWMRAGTQYLRYWRGCCTPTWASRCA